MSDFKGIDLEAFVTSHEHVVYVTREDSFAAAHRLYSDKLTEEENLSIFGKCTNANGHGHNYKYKVTLRIKPNKDTGLLLNLTELKAIMRKHITDVFDHKNLNLDFPIFTKINPTTENLTLVIWRILLDKVPEGTLYKVSVSSGERNKFVYMGERD